MNRELLKGTAIFVLDLAMELEYQRRHPREKCIEYGPLDFTFDDEGECVVRHHDGRLGEISIDPDEITVNVTYRNKGMTIRTESDKRLAPRDIMDIIGDFLDYGTMDQEFIPREDPPLVQIRESTPPVLPIRKWLLQSFVAYSYEARPDSEAGLEYGHWCIDVAKMTQDQFCSFISEDLSEITEMLFCKTIGNLGFLPQENFDDNIRVAANVLKSANALPMQLHGLLTPYFANE